MGWQERAGGGGVSPEHGVGLGLAVGGTSRLGCLTFPPFPPQGLLRARSLRAWRGLHASAALQQIPRAKVRAGAQCPP